MYTYDDKKNWKARKQQQKYYFVVEIECFNLDSVWDEFTCQCTSIYLSKELIKQHVTGQTSTCLRVFTWNYTQKLLCSKQINVDEGYK